MDLRHEQPILAMHIWKLKPRSVSILLPAIAEFGALVEGHTTTPLLSLRNFTGNSGLRWHEERFADRHHDKAEPDIWMRPSNGDAYEYIIGVYVHDLAIIVRAPQEIANVLLQDKYRFKLSTKELLVVPSSSILIWISSTI